MMTDVEAWKVWIDFNKNQRGFRWPGSWEPCLLMLSAEWQCGHYQCRGDTWPSPPPPTDHRANHQHRQQCLIEPSNCQASKCKITYYLLAGSPLLPHYNNIPSILDAFYEVPYCHPVPRLSRI